MFHHTVFISFLVWFGLLSGHLMGNSCSLSHCSLTICDSSISRFGFEGWIWVQIASVPDLCIHFTFLMARLI